MTHLDIYGNAHVEVDGQHVGDVRPHTDPPRYGDPFHRRGPRKWRIHAKGKAKNLDGIGGTYDTRMDAVNRLVNAVTDNKEATWQRLYFAGQPVGWTLAISDEVLAFHRKANSDSPYRTGYYRYPASQHHPMPAHRHAPPDGPSGWVPTGTRSGRCCSAPERAASPPQMRRGRAGPAPEEQPGGLSSPALWWWQPGRR